MKSKKKTRVEEEPRKSVYPKFIRQLVKPREWAPVAHEPSGFHNTLVWNGVSSVAYDDVDGSGSTVFQDGMHVMHKLCTLRYNLAPELVVAFHTEDLSRRFSFKQDPSAILPVDVFVVVEPGTLPTPGVKWFVFEDVHVMPMITASPTMLEHSTIGCISRLNVDKARSEGMWVLGADGQPSAALLKALNVPRVYDTYMEAFESKEFCHLTLHVRGLSFLASCLERYVEVFDVPKRTEAEVSADLRAKVNNFGFGTVPDTCRAYDAATRSVCPEFVDAVGRLPNVTGVRWEMKTPHTVKNGFTEYRMLVALLTRVRKTETDFDLFYVPAEGVVEMDENGHVVVVPAAAPKPPREVVVVA